MSGPLTGSSLANEIHNEDFLQVLDEILKKISITENASSRYGSEEHQSHLSIFERSFFSPFPSRIDALSAPVILITRPFYLTYEIAQNILFFLCCIIVAFWNAGLALITNEKAAKDEYCFNLLDNIRVATQTLLTVILLSCCLVLGVCVDLLSLITRTFVTAGQMAMDTVAPDGHHPNRR